eukprot:CAMPEP_0172311632 /NCGR_PEP_ID=MMETSP1058-20130122/15347_1 /TAXON_ID=83371 /ORGANISM="Detonula confervacea, Strain CCMP 353" /LENGTH=1057 /DNA_ID=CAMNT_0013024889 /DNA_START=145 /DNA_END=3314 /DNA_ORIENTATION=+
MMKFSIVSILVASCTSNSCFSCHAAFMPGSTGRSSIGSIKSVRYMSNKFQLPDKMNVIDNLPKSLSDMEINMPTPPNIDGMKDKLASLSKTRPMFQPSDDITSDSSTNLPSVLRGPSPPRPPLKPSPPPPFDPTNPEALISITKSFLATDFGILSSQVPDYSTAPKSKSTTSTMDSTDKTSVALPFYSSSLLSSNSFVWISGNNIDDGRTGLLTKDEYLAAGRFFDLRKSFPDIEYKAHDFRIIYDEEKEYSTKKSMDGQLSLGGGDSATTPIGRLDKGEITVRFTTRTTGTFRGAPFRLRSMTLEPNGKVMRCPPTSISITYSTEGEDRGKIIKLVTDMVLDRQVGNTNGFSGVPAAAVIGGAPPNALVGVPPLVALGRFVGRPLKPIDNEAAAGDSYLAPFPDSVMIQLAKGVLASNLGLNDANLLAEKFVYIEPLMGPMDKDKYLEVFSEEYNVREGVPDLDYGLQNFRVDPYDPYRVWIDSRATGTRIGDIGKRGLPPNVNAAAYKGPPEGISFTFDDDGFCTRLTAAAVLDPLLGNTGGLGGVYGLLYATGTPVSALKTRSLNGFLNRARKSLLSGVTGVGPDGWSLSDGRTVNSMLPAGVSSIISLPSSATSSIKAATAALPKSVPAAKPFFAVEATTKPQRPTIALPKVGVSADSKTAATKPIRPPTTLPAVTKTIQIKQEVETKKTAVAPISDAPGDPITDALNSAFGITTNTPPANPTKGDSSSAASTAGSKAQQLRNAAEAARAEAADAKKKAEAQNFQELVEKQAVLDARLEKQKQDQLQREQQADDAAQKRKQELDERQVAVEARLEKQKQEQLRMQQLAEDAAQKKKQMIETAKKKKEETQAVAAKQSQMKKTASSTKRGVTTSKAGAAPGNPGDGMFSFLGLQSSAPKSESSPSPKAKLVPAKSSPTVSLFASKSSVKPKAKTPVAKSTASSSAVKRSPTISLFGASSTKANSKAAAKKSVIPKTKTSSKKTSSKSSLSATKPQLRKKSPTLNIFGIGGSVAQPTNSSKKLSSAKSKLVLSAKKEKKSTTSKSKSSSESSQKA